MSARVLSLLWPKNAAVVQTLESTHGCKITGPDALMGAVRPEIVAEARARFDRAAPAIATVVAPQPDQTLRAGMAAAMAGVLGERLTAAISVIDHLERLHTEEPFVGILLNEAETSLGKVTAAWGQLHAVPVFMLSHGANVANAYTVVRETQNVDYLFVFGERGAEPYVDRGFPRERIVVTGNPAWDAIPAQLAARGQTRARLRTALNVPDGVPLLLFCTTWNAKLTALYDAHIFQKTLAAFFGACAELQRRGVPFATVVKDRPSNAEFGKEEATRIAQRCGVDGFTYATGDLPPFLMAADLMVGYESSAFVEAMLVGIPAINLWTPSTGLMGPGFGCDDAIPAVRAHDVAALADVCALLLREQSVRDELTAAMRARLERFDIGGGMAAQRCAAEIAARVRVPAAV